MENTILDNNSNDDVLFKVQSDLSLRRKIDTARTRMGRAYPGFLLVAACVIAFNYYLIMTGKNAQNDAKKTVTLFVLMVIWAFVPVVIGLIKHLLSKVTDQTIDIYKDKIIVETSIKTSLETKEITANDFSYVYEFGDCIKVDKGFKNVLLIDKKDVVQGDGEKLAEFFRAMKE